jgi:hypothetical protein
MNVLRILARLFVILLMLPAVGYAMLSAFTVVMAFKAAKDAELISYALGKFVGSLMPVILLVFFFKLLRPRNQAT